MGEIRTKVEFDRRVAWRMSKVAASDAIGGKELVLLVATNELGFAQSCRRLVEVGVACQSDICRQMFSEI